MNAKIKNLKIHEGLSEETLCFNASLHIDDRKVADVSNRGCGGCNDIRFTDPDAEKALLAYVATQPPHKCEYGELEIDLDFFISLLVGAAQREKHLARAFKSYSKKSVLFRLQGESYEAGQVHCTEHRGKRALVAALLKKEYGDRIEFVNTLDAFSSEAPACSTRNLQNS